MLLGMCVLVGLFSAGSLGVPVFIITNTRPVPACISTPVDLGPYPRPVAVLVYKSDVPAHLY